MFAVALVVRLAYWAIALPDYVPIADADQYRRLGRSIASGNGFQLIYPQMAMHATAFRPPLYPALLAPGFALFGDQSLWPARLLSVVLGSLVVVLIGVLTARLAGRIAGLVAAGVAAVYPPLLANDTVVLTEPLAFFLLLGAILLIDERRWLPGGVFLGLLLLTRPNVYLLIVVLVVWLWRSIGVRRAAGLVAVTALVVAPWLVRNHLHVHTWRPTTSDGLTITAVYGLPSQRANTFTDPVFSPAYGDAVHVFDRFDEARWNSDLTGEGLRGLRRNPRYLAVVARRNFQGYFEFDTALNRFPEDSDGRLWRFRQDTLPIYWFVTAGGLVGLAVSLQRRRPLAVVLVLGTAQFVVLSLVLVAPPRLRGPFDVAMCVGVGVAVAEVIDRRARRANEARTALTATGA
jgi:4-amino-4-deoxy-L-arabinose transferase-like glycosyltransferase